MLHPPPAKGNFHIVALPLKEQRNSYFAPPATLAPLRQFQPRFYFIHIVPVHLAGLVRLR